MATIPEALVTAVRLHNSGQLASAREIYRQIIAIKPDHLEAWRRLGLAAHAERDLKEAIVAYREALRLSPNQARLYSNLGTALRESGRASEAIAAYREALLIDPRLPVVESNLGALLIDEKKLDEAAACFERALELRPEYALAHYNMGNIRKDQGRYDDAIACYESYLASVGIRPMAHGQNNLGTSCRTPETVAKPNECFRHAIVVEPQHCEAINELAGVFNLLGSRARAQNCLDQLLAVQPDNARARFHRATLRIGAGEFVEGWEEFEARWDCPQLPGPTCSGPKWDGSPLNGRVIVVHAEQGFGDTLQFARYLPLIPRDGGRVYFQVQPALVQLLEKSGFRYLVPTNAPLPEFDMQIALMSLPGLFATSLESIPRQVPYLYADEELVTFWKPRLSATAGFRVGISWQGNPLQQTDGHRSIPLSHFAPLAQEGVQLISLQQNFGKEQLTEVASRFDVTDWSDEMDRSHGSFMDTAALMKSLDLVITSDTAIAHLAGALAVPVWVALPTPCDWRWLLEREDCPWYPTMRLFRQTQLGRWDNVFARIAAELRQLAVANRSERD